MVTKFQPSTDMEQQIDALLTTSGMDESSLKNTEDRALAMNELTEDEVSSGHYFFTMFFISSCN
jgi:U3 small nucleolar RNA-associated protein 14